MTQANPVASANAGRASRLQSDASGPAWLRFALAMKSLLQLSTPLVLLLLASCAVPLPGFTVRRTMSERKGLAGECVERIEQQGTYSKTYYPITMEGGPAKESWPRRFDYFLVDTNGQREKLSFLSKHFAHRDYFVGLPISGERWIAITLPNKKGGYIEVHSDLQVFVFRRSTVLVSKVVKGAYSYDPAEPLPESSGWKPVTGNPGYRSKSVGFDKERETVTFTTPEGDVSFDPNNGSLRAVEHGKG